MVCPGNQMSIRQVNPCVSSDCILTFPAKKLPRMNRYNDDQVFFNVKALKH